MAALLLLLLLASCLPSGPPPRPEPQRRQLRLLRASFSETWRATRAALEESHLELAEAEEPKGVLRAGLRRRRRSDQEALEPELLRVGDLAAAKRRGLRNVSEYRVECAVELSRIDEQETRVDVSTRITAIDRSEAVVLPPGFLQVIPRSFDVPSNGTLERQLVARIGGTCSFPRRCSITWGCWAETDPAVSVDDLSAGGRGGGYVTGNCDRF